jgi:hypothetical protein
MTVEDAFCRANLFPKTLWDFAHGKNIAKSLATPGLSTASNCICAQACSGRDDYF